MIKTRGEKLDEYRRVLAGFRQQYKDDGTIPKDDQDYLNTVFRKTEHPLLADLENEPSFAFQDGNKSSAPQAAKSPKSSVPVYHSRGMADPLPKNKPPGLMLWNFQDGSAEIHSNQQAALKSQLFYVPMRDSQKKFEIIGYTSGIGLDAAGGTSLANKRARAVRDFLVAVLAADKNGPITKIGPEKFLRTYGKGSASPLEKDLKNGKPWAEGAAKNRRVEILPTSDIFVIPDEVVDDIGGVGDAGGIGEVAKGGGGGDVGVRDKLPPGKSDSNSLPLTAVGAIEQAGFIVEYIVPVGGAGVAAGAAGAIIGPAMLMMKVTDAWRQAQKQANRRGGAYGFKLGATAAVGIIRAGNVRVTPAQLWNDAIKKEARSYTNEVRSVPLDWDEVERDIRHGAEQTADIVNKAMELAESELSKLLSKHFSAKNAKAIFDANIKTVRTISAQSLSDEIAKEVRSIENSR